MVGDRLASNSDIAITWGARDYDINVVLASKMWGQDPTGNYPGGDCPDKNARGECPDQLWFSTFNTNGVVGDRLLTNWIYHPSLAVRPRRYRFRILNGDVSRFMRLAIVAHDPDNNGACSDEQGRRRLASDPTDAAFQYCFAPFHMVANDGNLMKHAVPFGVNFDPSRRATNGATNRPGILPIITIAERHDIVVDFQHYATDTSLYVINLMDHKNGRQPEGPHSFEDSLGRLLDILRTEGLQNREAEHNFWNDQAVGTFMRMRVADKADVADNSMDPADYVEGELAMIPPALAEDVRDNPSMFNAGNFKYGPEPSSRETLRVRRFLAKRGAKPVPGAEKEAPPDQSISVPLPGRPAGATGNAPVYHTKSLFDQELKRYKETLTGGNEVELPWGIRNLFDEVPNDTYQMDPAVAAHSSEMTAEFGMKPQVWIFESNGGWAHNMHVHFEEGVLLWSDEDGDTQELHDWERFARKDVYVVGGDMRRSVAFLIRFRDVGGMFMSHCHNTQHEDHAMLQRWDVTGSGQVDAFPAPLNQWNGCTYTPSRRLADDTKKNDDDDDDDSVDDDSPSPVCKGSKKPCKKIDGCEWKKKRCVAKDADKQANRKIDMARASVGNMKILLPVGGIFAGAMIAVGTYRRRSRRKSPETVKLARATSAVSNINPFLTTPTTAAI